MAITKKAMKKDPGGTMTLRSIYEIARLGAWAAGLDYGRLGDQQKVALTEAVADAFTALLRVRRERIHRAYAAPYVTLDARRGTAFLLHAPLRAVLNLRDGGHRDEDIEAALVSAIVARSECSGALDGFPMRVKIGMTAEEGAYPIIEDPIIVRSSVIRDDEGAMP